MKEISFGDYYGNRWQAKGAYINGKEFNKAIDEYLKNPTEAATEKLVEDYLDVFAANIIRAFLNPQGFNGNLGEIHIIIITGMVMALRRGQYNKKRKGRAGDKTTAFRYLTSVGRNEMMQHLRKEAKHTKTAAIVIEHMASNGARGLDGIVEKDVDMQLITGNKGGF